MKKVLVTGGSGFFGGILKNRLLAEGFNVVNLDLVADPDSHHNLTSVQGDIRDAARVDRLFAEERFDSVIHCAAMLAHEKIDDATLWSSNVDGTHTLADACRRRGVKSLVFTSSNCLWAHNVGHPVREDDPPAPVEIYGRSKFAAEQVLQQFHNDLAIVMIRCPTIIDSGRLGLLAILFEFIHEGRKVWVVGNGANRYQFIYARTSPRRVSNRWSLAGPIPSTSVQTMCQPCERYMRPSFVPPVPPRAWPVSPGAQPSLP